jgi:8-oxo-dGTP diphosphatase
VATEFASIVLVDQRGWLLLQERDEHPLLDPERWGLPGGHVEVGEAPEDAAHRELAEETGVALEPGGLEHWGDVAVFHEATQSWDTVHVYAAATALTDADIVVGEGRRIVFVEPSAARGLDLTAGARLVVPEFLDSPTYADLLAGDGAGERR